MKRFVILIVALWIMTVSASAQTPIAPSTPIPAPAGYLDTCNQTPELFDYFGPNCLNPVHWDLAGFRRIGAWAFFLREDGTTDGGVIVGFTWQFQEGRYHYYLMTQMPHYETGFGGRFENIPPERLLN